MFYRFLRYTIFGLLAFVGCTAEDRTVCPTSIKVVHSFTLNKEYADMFAQRVRRTSLYIFDDKGLFYDEKTITDPSLMEGGNTVVLDLRPGTYTVVSWGGVPEWYKIGENINGRFSEGLTRGVSSLASFRLLLPTDASGADMPTASEPADLFHGMTENVMVENGESAVIPISVIKNTHTIHLTVNGLDNIAASKAAAPIDVYVSAGNHNLYHNNTFDLSGGVVKYLPNSFLVDGTQLRTSIKVLRLVPSHPMMLVGRDAVSGTNYFNFDLLPYIMQSPTYNSQAELDRESDFDVVVTVGINLDVVVYINGWKVVNIIPI